MRTLRADARVELWRDLYQVLTMARVSRLLHGAVLAQDSRQCAEQNREIEPQTPRIDVFQVEFHPAVEAGVAPSADLPETGHPGLHAKPSHEP